MRITLLCLFILSLASAGAQTKYLPLSDFKFHGITAQYQDDTTTVYSLLCTGLPVNSAKTDSLTSVWLASHPDATAEPVCSFSYYNNMGNRVTYTYIWLVSNTTTDPSLNIYLVKNKACSASSMLWAKSAATSQPTINHYQKMKSETKVFVSKTAYKNFVHELQKAPVRKKFITKK